MGRNNCKQNVFAASADIFDFASGLRFWKSAQGSPSVRSQNRLFLQARVPTEGCVNENMLLYAGGKEQ